MTRIHVAPADPLYRHDGRGGAVVTVTISLHNYAAYVVEALDSVAAQSLPLLDLILVDDASDDEGAELARAWMERQAGRFGRCALLRHRQNQGVVAARNLAFQEAVSAWVFVLDADNQIYPRCLEACLAAAATSDAEAFYPIIERFGTQSWLMGSDPWDPARLRQGNYIDAMAMISRAAWDALDGYRRMPYGGLEDYDFWLRLAERGGRAEPVPEILGRYRVHADSMLRRLVRSPEQQAALRADMQRRHGRRGGAAPG